MRKLGIIFAIAAAAAATLGIAGTASADGHETTLCPPLDTVAQGAAQSPDPMSPGTPGGTGTPVKQIAGGAHESCLNSNSTDGLDPVPLICGVADGIEGMDDQLADLAQAVRDNPINPVECGDDNTPLCTDCGNKGGNNTSNNGGGTDPEVLANNATADGGLPRTGAPELLAGLGFGVTGIGALVRRFVG